MTSEISPPLSESRDLDRFEEAARAFDGAVKEVAVAGHAPTSDFIGLLAVLAAEARRGAAERTAPFDALLSRMGAVDRRDRPQSPMELLADIAAVRRGEMPALPSPRLPVWIFAAAFGGIVAIGFIIAGVSGRPSPRYIDQEGGKHRLVYHFKTRAELTDWYPARPGEQPDRPEWKDESMVPGTGSYWCTVPFEGDVELEATVEGPQATIRMALGPDGRDWFAKATFGTEFTLKLAGNLWVEPVPLEWKGQGTIRIVKKGTTFEFYLERKLILVYQGRSLDPEAKPFLFAVQGPARFDRIAVTGKIQTSWFRK